MKQASAIAFIISILFSFTTTMAQEQYPTFSQEYWKNEQDIAQGKIVRGAALGVTGLVLIWPTAVMISRSKENPSKYIPLSLVLGAASLGAMGHGFSSIGHGIKQKETATYWVEMYSTNPDSVDIAEQQEDYLYEQQVSASKSTIFGIYTATIATTLLTNGIIQSTRSDEDVAANDIHIWPYYAVGGTLLPSK